MLSKYGAKKTTVDGVIFDSKAEAKYYEQLKWMKANKQIKDFELQPKFLLQEAFKKNGKTFRKIEYIADFKVINLDDTVEIVDIKGAITKEFAIKRKLFERMFLDKLILLGYDWKLGFMDWHELQKIKPKRKAKPKRMKKVR
ncbi:DUF1064 domain-containing protein [Bacillus sp. JJ722]|uniref:DUF1064 domain-containing protein n=1 Tax=Bacillus sp. JJ722 TaxID=3122973 RepID=UPI002FFF9611